MDIDETQLQDIRDAQQLGFVTALNGAGYAPEDINRLYQSYESQREAREDTLAAAYEAITGE
jgi:hypothetical protein